MRIGHKRMTCMVCDARDLVPLIWIEQAGVPHGEAGHNYVYSVAAMLVCPKCRHAQLEEFSHDCWDYDEDWDMYWWYVLDPSGAERLRALIETCPAPHDPRCSCAAHSALRSTCERLYGGVRHVCSPDDQASYARISLQVMDGAPAFQVERG